MSQLVSSVVHMKLFAFVPCVSLLIPLSAFSYTTYWLNAPACDVRTGIVYLCFFSSPTNFRLFRVQQTILTVMCHAMPFVAFTICACCVDMLPDSLLSVSLVCFFVH